jgi:hypothetical protein
MQQKDFIGLLLIACGIAGGIACCCLWKRARDIFFVVMVLLAPMTEFVDVNFVSRDWYRGTTRGFEVSLVDILSLSLLVGGLLAPRRGEARGYWPASFGLMILLFLYACFNVGMADPRLFGWFELSKMVRGLTIFLAVAFFVRSERELKLLLAALAVVVCFEGLLALKQRYLNGVHRVFGTIDDSNSLSFFFCTTVPVLAAALNSRMPRLVKILSVAGIALACVGVVLTISRTGVMTLGLTLVGVTLTTISWKLSARKVLIGMIALVGLAGITAKSWKTLHARFAESNVEKEYGNKRTMGRGYYIRIAIAISEDQPFGVGLNNWSFWTSNKYGPRLGYRFVPYKGTDKEPSNVVPEGSNVDMAQAAPAHSLAALTLGELGLPGLALFSLLWLRWFQMGVGFLWSRRPEAMQRIGTGLFFAVMAMFLHSVTEWVFRQSPIYYVTHILLGALASLYYVRRRERRMARVELAGRDEVLNEEPCDQAMHPVCRAAGRNIFPEKVFSRAKAGWAGSVARPGRSPLLLTEFSTIVQPGCR